MPGSHQAAAAMSRRNLSHAEKFSKLKLPTDVLIIIIYMNKPHLLIGLTLLAAFASAMSPCPLQS